MADMLVDGAKLDACLDAEADAIRAKTGGSADIPFDFANNKGFADAIAAIPTGGQKWTTDVNAVAGTQFLTNNNLITVAIPASTNFYVKVTGANIIDSSGLNGVYAWREDGTKPVKYNIKPDGEAPMFFTDDAVVGVSFYCVAARVIGTGTLTLEVGVI